MESRFFTTRNGLQLHYISHPCARAHSTSFCVLLHGFTNDAHVWDALAAELQQSHHVMALDHRGHGDSDWDSERRYSHWQLAEDLQDFLQLLGDVTIHIVGHSLGARVAILALETLPCSIASLTIIDAGPEVNAEAAERLVNDVMQLPLYYADAKAYRDCLARIYMLADTRALAHIASFGLRVMGGKLRSKTDPAFISCIWHKNPEFQNMYKHKGGLSEQIWKILEATDISVHVVRGQASSILDPAQASKMIKVLGARGVLSVVPGAGHAVMLDSPVQSVALITKFIANLIRKTTNVNGPAQKEKELESQV